MSTYPVFDPAACSVARTLEVLGDTWSLLVLRELFLGARRFDQMQQHLGIARNVLAARLKRLLEHGVLERRQHQEHPPRFEYHLTRKGLDLQPVIAGLLQWGDRYLADAEGGPFVLEHASCAEPLHVELVCRTCQKHVRPSETRVQARRLSAG